MPKKKKKLVHQAEDSWTTYLYTPTCHTAKQQRGDGCHRREWRDFLGGAVVKNPPANAGDTGLSPGPGRSHILQSN